MKTYFKPKKIRLKGIKLKRLKQACIERDRFCQYSGSPFSLQAHHIVFLSQGGEDKLTNLVAVSANVHEDIHRYRLKVTGTAPNNLKWEEVT